MKQLLAVDLDGTLVYDLWEMTERNQRAMHKLKEVGHYIVVSTGRSFTDSVFLKKDFQVDYDFLVLLNGALLIDKQDNIIKQEIIPTDIATAIYEKYTLQDTWEASFSDGFKYIWYNQTPTEESKNDVFIDSLDEMVNHPVSLISIHCHETDPSVVQRAVDAINEEYGDYVVAYRNVLYIDVVAKGCSKGAGVLQVAKKFGVTREQIHTIGDSWSDVTMFQITENSYTFTHVEKALREYVNYLVADVAECVEKLLAK